MKLSERERSYYANKFNSVQENVKSWEELSYDQKQSAYATFPLNFGVSADAYVYSLGASGTVICRAKDSTPRCINDHMLTADGKCSVCDG